MAKWQTLSDPMWPGVATELEFASSHESDLLRLEKRLSP